MIVSSPAAWSKTQALNASSTVERSSGGSDQSKCTPQWSRCFSVARIAPAASSTVAICDRPTFNVPSFTDGRPASGAARPAGGIDNFFGA
jgi:hypothetical protein